MGESVLCVTFPSGEEKKQTFDLLCGSAETLKSDTSIFRQHQIVLSFNTMSISIQDPLQYIHLVPAHHSKRP